MLLYSASEQPLKGGQIPYAMSSLCRPNEALANADDMDLWLLWSAAEYGLATRDLPAFNVPVRYSDGATATLWSHLKRAFEHQESLLGPHGTYLSPGAGDWSDFSTSFLQMTESNLVSAQLAYVYPRLAQLADLRGDRSFARTLRAAGARNLAVTRREWTGDGWYSRGYSGDRQIGRGAIFGEPQPWAILAGAPSGGQARTLVHNIRRYLTGVGAPAAARGPARIGSSQSPASSDPGVTERSSPVATATGDNNAVFVGGSWYAVNGWLAWSLGELGDTVPGARRYAFDELQRNTLRAHARAYPRHWGGTISVDDVCRAHFSTDPARCGIGLTGYTGQIMHQPAWLLYDTIRLAGIEPTTRGYRIQPQLPLRRFSLRLPRAGVAYGPAGARGYVVTSRSTRLRIEVTAPPAGRSWPRPTAPACARGSGAAPSSSPCGRRPGAPRSGRSLAVAEQQRAPALRGEPAALPQRRERGGHLVLLALEQAGCEKHARRSAPSAPPPSGAAGAPGWPPPRPPPASAPRGGRPAAPRGARSRSPARSPAWPPPPPPRSPAPRPARSPAARRPGPARPIRSRGRPATRAGSTPSISSRHSRVVAWAPVPNAWPGSTTRSIRPESAAGGSHGGRTRTRPPISTGRWNSRQRSAQSSATSSPGHRPP